MPGSRLSPTTRALTHPRPNAAYTYTYTPNRFSVFSAEIEHQERREHCADLPFAREHRLSIQYDLGCNTSVRKHDQGFYLEMAELLRELREGWGEMLVLYA